MLAALAVLTVAFVVRHWSLGVLPPLDRTGFEELEMGADGYRVLTTGVLPLEFRFSKAISALGLSWGGENLHALRVPFQLMGYATLLVLWLCLRNLGVRRWPSAFIVISAAAARWFVIGSGVAYEDFSPILWMELLLLCLIKLDFGRRSAAAWAACAGALAGVLMFENSSFRFATVFAAVWVVWLTAVRGRGAWERWRPLAYFSATGALVALPMMADVLRRGSRSIFFEAIVRYANGRPTVLPPRFAASVGQSLALIAGLPMRISFYLAPEASHAIHPLLGALFAGAAVTGLAVRGRPLVRALVLAALGAVIVCSATTNFFAASRLAPVLSILLLPAGVLLEDIGAFVRKALAAVNGRLGVSGRVARSGSALGSALVYGLLAAAVVNASAHRVAAMAASSDVRNEYLNDQYVTASYLEKAAAPGMHVLVVTPTVERDWTRGGIAYWVFARKHLDVRGTTVMPRADDVPGGVLLVYRPEGRPLEGAEIAALRELANRTGSNRSLTLMKGHGGRVILGSVCVHCDGRRNPGGA